MEEESQNALAIEVAKIYDDVVDRHVGAREDQIVYELMHRLKAADVKIKCMLGSQSYDKYEKKQIDCVAYCTELKEVKAMQEQAGEYFDTIEVPDEQIVSAQLRHATERQVRTCLKRLSKTLAVKRFQERGCQYRQPEWKLSAFKARWEPFKEKSERIHKFAPWMPMTKSKLTEASSTIKKAAEVLKKGSKFSSNMRTGIKSTKAVSKPVSKANGSWNSIAKKTEKPAPMVAWKTQQPASAPAKLTVQPQQSPMRSVTASPARQMPVQQQPPVLLTVQLTTQPYVPRNPGQNHIVYWYNPFLQQPLGVTVNMESGAIYDVNKRAPVYQMGVRAGFQIVALNGQMYSKELYAALCQCGCGPFEVLFLNPNQQVPARRSQPVQAQQPTQQSQSWSSMVRPRRAPARLSPAQARPVRLSPARTQPARLSPARVQPVNRSPNRSPYARQWPVQMQRMPAPRNTQPQVVRAPVNQTATYMVPMRAQNLTSSSGSSRQGHSRSVSRTPDRSVPRSLVPCPDRAVKITSTQPLDVKALTQKFHFAGVFPKEIKLLNEHCAYASFDSVFSTNLASRSDLGPLVKIKLYRESAI